MTQDPSSAKGESMPQEVIGSDVADFVLNPEKYTGKIATIVKTFK
jgi:chemotaxis response regulator CheB